MFMVILICRLIEKGQSGFTFGGGIGHENAPPESGPGGASPSRTNLPLRIEAQTLGQRLPSVMLFVVTIQAQQFKIAVAQRDAWIVNVLLA